MSTGFPVLDQVLEEDPEFKGILDDSDNYPAEAIATFLKWEGKKVSASTIRTYRRALAAQQGV